MKQFKIIQRIPRSVRKPPVEWAKAPFAQIAVGQGFTVPPEAAELSVRQACTNYGRKLGREFGALFNGRTYVVVRKG